MKSVDELIDQFHQIQSTVALQPRNRNLFLVMKKIISVRKLDGYRLSLRFNDGVQGDIDLSDLVGKGVFACWRDQAFFNEVTIGEFGELTWDGRVDLCPDALYSKITGQRPSDFSRLRSRPR